MGEYDFVRMFQQADAARIKLLDLVEFLQNQNRLLLTENARLHEIAMGGSGYHGLRGYKDKCRCEICVNFMSEYNRKYRDIYKQRRQNAKIQD